MLHAATQPMPKFFSVLVGALAYILRVKLLTAACLIQSYVEYKVIHVLGQLVAMLALVVVL